MIRVTTLSNPRLAQAFIDYMKTQGVAMEMHPQGRAVELWLVDDNVLPRVEEALDVFLRDPLHPRYQAASWHAGTAGRGQFRYQAASWLPALRSRAGPLTLGVTICCILVFALMNIFGDVAVMRWLAFPSGPGQYGQLWRWVSHILLHFSLLHILFNLVWWWYLGCAMEKHRGSFSLAVLTIVAAVVSGLVQFRFSGALFGGLSGVVYALMGYVWWYGEKHPDGPLQMPRGVIVFALLWLIAGYFDILGIAIANAAHVAGLVVGLLLAFWDTRRGAGTARRR
ncbi:rhomboid family intramembrane serine protease GlpG [Martelella alba]|uniref:Rhomboid family intramembrane serine protease GlpG n=1 Tax=Martelella alba TaxID=2590451 RepID=A0ABY2SI52_9HYPH|nr:rhomboid family intramembrane serine protease GlpG [Martelella alba]TKI05041.1 rhomboid family intramembrane serine protease GlpG [Martelella alba]